MGLEDVEKGTLQPNSSHERTITSNMAENIVASPPDRQLERGLESRHIQFIALGGTIGTGLFLGIGGALAQAGPLSLLLGYLFSSVAIWAMMQCLGEMTTWLPLPGMIAQLGSRYVDPAFGFAIGWNQWYNCAIGICGEVSAAVVLVQFWDDSISPAVWISIILVLVLLLNCATVSLYGEAEFWFASIKIITIVGLLIFALVIDLGGGPNHDRLGFRYWNDPGAMKTYVSSDANTGRFLGLFSVLVNAAFAFGGVEQVAVAAGEARNPTRTIPKAIDRVFWRILFFYIFGAFAVGLIVPSNSPNLLSGSSTAKSPWVIASQIAGVKVLPHIINAVIITSASSSANAGLYTGSRYLYALAQQKQAPKIFLRCNKQGNPYLCVLMTGVFGALTYMTVSAGGSTIFQWFQSLVATAGLCTWSAICVAYIRWHKALRFQNIDRAELGFRATGQLYSAYGAICFFLIVLLFNGFKFFTKGNWDAKDFVSAYVGLSIFAALYVFWKVLRGTKLHKIEDIDIFTGRDEILAKETWQREEESAGNGNFVQRMWNCLV